jgi:hypothetical protein
MKHILTRAPLFLLLLTGFTSALKAEILESNLTFQLKVYIQLDYQENGDKGSQTYQITTYKTGDVAKKLAAMRGVTVSKNARIIQRIRYRNGLTTTSWLVRDKGIQDTPVDFDKILLTDAQEVKKYKGSLSKNTSTSTSLSNGTYDVTQVLDEKFSYSGSLTTTRRSIVSKEDSEVRLDLVSRSLNGHGIYSKPKVGGGFVEHYSTAIIKASVPKVLPSPLE